MPSTPDRSPSAAPARVTSAAADALPASAAIGRWMFRRRTWLPLPFAAALLVFDTAAGGWVVAAAGVLLVVAGQGLRFWAVRHIGVISRTRSTRVGPLVTSGPFGIVRNPIYLGNLCLWSGVTCVAGALWMLPICALIFFAHYHLMVRWEEHLLESHHDEAYRDYARGVPRWVPRWTRGRPAAGSPPHSWRQIFFSERGTILALSLMIVLLAAD